MAWQRRDLNARHRMSERWQRQDEADRLLGRIPTLRRLSIAVEERSGYTTIAAVSHVRRVVVESAPALFEIQCSSDECDGGYYDVTYDVLQALKRGVERFDFACTCNGTVRGAACPREARFVGVARFDESPSRQTSSG